MRKIFALYKNDKLKSNPFINWIELFILMIIIWFILSGIFQFQFIMYGFFSSAIISFFMLKHLYIENKITKDEYFILHINYIRFILYLIWLLKEIIISSIEVSKIVISKKNRIEPAIIWFKANYQNPMAKVLLANSITLTPGTITIDMFENGVYSVHSLNDNFCKSVETGIMQKKVGKVYGEELEFKILDTKKIKVKAQKSHLITNKITRQI